MRKEKMKDQTPKIISMSKSTKETISKVANEINGKNLFTEKIELAKKSLQNLKSLPI